MVVTQTFRSVRKRLYPRSAFFYLFYESLRQLALVAWLVPVRRYSSKNHRSWRNELYLALVIGKIRLSRMPIRCLAGSQKVLQYRAQGQAKVTCQ